ncbi:hypothetical protein J7E88_18905 [Streptomyces sp. ISL-10]|nr:hypothetical protein [Streptomyces sp. ISL-10]
MPDLCTHVTLSPFLDQSATRCPVTGGPPVIPQLRARCAITVASLALATLPLAPAAHAEPSEPPGPRPVVKPSPSASFAGRQAGQGRPRPGRQLPTASARPSVDPARSATAPTASSSASTPSAPPSARPSRPARTPSSPWAHGPRTGRPEEHHPPADDEAPRRDEDGGYWGAWSPAAPTSAPADARDQGPEAVPAPVAQQISPLSLGVGMALMGLGIGFLGIRLRRR